MTQIQSDILFNEIHRFEFDPTKLTKCGEIQITDCCTNAYIFCAFCSDFGGKNSSIAATSDTRFFTTLQDFIAHIRWHRSDDRNSPLLQKGITSIIGFDNLVENDSQGDDLYIKPPLQDTEFLTDWIAPPEELFASNIIGNFIEMEPQLHETTSTTMVDDQQQKPQTDPTFTTTQCNDDVPELTGEVFIELLNLYKKCPCVWHEKVASKTTTDVIDGVYKLLTMQYNRLTQQSKSVEYVRQMLRQIKSCFLEEYKDINKKEYNVLPWYFPYLSFILDCDLNEPDKSIFTDSTCPVCMLSLSSQEDLWKHILEIHLELQPQIKVTNDDDAPKLRYNNIDLKHSFNPETNKMNLFSDYPTEVFDKFIETYRSQKYIWDKNNKEYYSCMLRRKLNDELLNILHEHDPTATYDDVDRGVEYLRDIDFSDEDYIKEGAHYLENGYGDMKTKTSLDILPMCINQNELIVENSVSNINRNALPISKSFRKKIISLECPICATTFNEHSPWINHMDMAHSSQDYQFKDGFFYCILCGWQNKTKKLLMRHLRNRHTNNFHTCADCNLRFSFLSTLVDHRTKVHENLNPFQCDGFPTRSQLLKHSVTNRPNEEESDICSQTCSIYAGKKLRRKPTNVQHQKLYKKKMVCKFCKKKSQTVTELHQHLRTHRNLFLAHKCGRCGRGFQSAALLTKHSAEIHNNDSYSNSSRTFMDVFKNQLIGNGSHISCNICGAKFFRRLSLLKHKRLNHNRITDITS